MSHSPKRDVAAEITPAIFESDADAIKRVFAKQLGKGNYKVCAALADRAYGKPRQSFDLSAGDGKDSPACIRVEFVKSGFKEQIKSPRRTLPLDSGSSWSTNTRSVAEGIAVAFPQASDAVQ